MADSQMEERRVRQYPRVGVISGEDKNVQMVECTKKGKRGVKCGNKEI